MSFCCLRKLCMMQKQVIWSLVSIFFDSHELSIQWKQIVQNFRLFIQIYTDFKLFRKWSENSLWFESVWVAIDTLCMIYHKNFFSCYILLTDEMQLSDCLYFWKYCAICRLKLFVSQIVTSWMLTLTLSF